MRRIARVPSLILALALHALPLSRVFVTNTATGPSFAIVSAWIAGAVALLGGYDTVSGASTIITSPGTATGTNGTPFSYRITTGPDSANVFKAAPLPAGLTVGTNTGRITGIPTVDGVFKVLLTASDKNLSSRTVTKTLVLTILADLNSSNPPSITAQPVNRTATNGGGAIFTIGASGGSPLHYRWLANGAPLSGQSNATLTLTGVTTNQAVGYSVVVTNNWGAVTSATAMLTVLLPPSLDTPPLSQSVTEGDNVSLSVVASGTAPLSYQWRRNAASLAGATNAALNFSPVSLTQAGAYTVRVSNAAGAVTSAVATLTVMALPVPDTTRPTLTVVSPSAAFTRVTSNSFVISGTAQDNQGVAGVEVQEGHNAFAAVAGTNQWTASIALQPGTNVIRVRAIDTSGNLSLTNTKTVFYAVMTPLSLSINGSGAVAALTNNQLLELGKSYRLTATPAPGNQFSNWMVAGQAATGAVLNFTMVSNLAVVANFVPNPFTALKGAYSGLFYPLSTEPPHEQSGYFTLSVTDKGAYSGKLWLNGGSYSIRGSFGLALSAHNTVLRTGTNAVEVSLQLTGGSEQVTGFVSNAFWTSQLFGYRAVLSATNLLGKYTMLLSGGTDASLSPLGFGALGITVASSGKVTLQGTLGDATVAVQQGALAANGQLPIYLNLYRGKGSLFGWLTFTNTLTNDIPGLLLWTKKDGVPGSIYPGGFTNEVVALSSRYIPPLPGQPVLGFSNGIVVLEGGNLAGPATNDVVLSNLNKVTVASANTNKLVLTIVSSSGLLSGSHVNPQSLKKSVIKGVVLQKQDLGGGAFLGTNQSGRISFARVEVGFLYESAAR